MCQKLFVLVLMIFALLPPTHAAAQDATSKDAPDYARSGVYAIPGLSLGFVDSGIFNAINEIIRVDVDIDVETGERVKLGVSGEFWELPTVEPPSGIKYSRIDAAEFGDINTLFGVSIAGGYRFHPNFAFEGSFDWRKAQIPVAFTYRAPRVGTGFLAPVEIVTERIGNYTAWTVSANAKAFLLTGPVQPYAMVGLGIMGVKYEFDEDVLFRPDEFLVPEGFLCDASDSESCFRAHDNIIGFAPRFGAGVDLYASKHVALNIEVHYLLGVGSLHNENIISLLFGILYRF